MASQLPKLSVVVLAYNHAQFIEQALASVLMQEVDFPIEVIVGEDCSPDNTRQLVQAFAAQYPAVIRPLLHAQNVGMGANLRACLEACRGQYIALLEGDDYWTSPHKLQRQVAWLDQHPDFSICFHAVEERYEDGSLPPAGLPAQVKGEYTFEDFLTPGATIAPTGATVLRNVLPAWPAWLFTVNPIDFSLAALYAEKGKAKRLPETMSVYRIHRGGIWSGASRHLNSQRLLLMYEKLASHYAPTRYAPLLRRHLYDQCLMAANVHANHGFSTEAGRYVGRALSMGQAITYHGLMGLVGALLRLVRSVGRQPASTTIAP